MSIKGSPSNGEFSDDMKEHVRPAPPSAPASDYAPREKWPESTHPAALAEWICEQDDDARKELT